MSISFYIKNKKKFLGYETVLNVEEALTILNKELNTYNTRDIDINDLLLSPVSNYECLLIGEDKVSARGFELSYDNKNKDYAIRVFTPSSREDWLLALEYIKELAKKFNSEIVNEREEVYTVDNIDKFDYESDILYGIEVVSSNLKDKDIKVSPPVVVAGKDHTLSWPKNYPIVGIPFTTQYGPFEVDVCFK